MSLKRLYKMWFVVFGLMCALMASQMINLIKTVERTK